MPDVVLTEKLLAGLAGWEVIKQARTIVAEDRVLSSSWEPPTLRGVVQSGTTTFRAGLVIRRENDAENLCTCRTSREWGTLCAHSVAVGLHCLKPAPAPTPTAAPSAQRAAAGSPTGSPSARTAPSKDVRRLRRAAPGETAESLEIHVVFPTNFADSLTRGRATLFFEGRRARNQVPLASLAQSEPFALDDADARLLDAVELLALGDTPSMIQVAPADFATLLEALVDHPRLTLAKTRRLTVRSEPLRAPLRGRLLPSGEIELTLIPLPRPPVVVVGQRLWVITDADIRPLDLPADVRPALAGPLRLPRNRVPSFLASTLPALRASTDWQADFEPEDFDLTVLAPRLVLELAGGLAALTARLQCRYGPRIVPLGIDTGVDTGSAWMPDPENPRRYHTRDTAAEQAALARLLRAGFRGPDARGQFRLDGQNPVLTFFARDYPRLEREWEVTLEERLEKSTHQNLERIEPRFAINPSGEQWFDLRVDFASGSGDRIPADEIQRLLRGGQSHTRLKNGKFALLDTGAVEELEELLVDTSPEQHAGTYRIGNEQAGFLDATLRQCGWQPVAPTAWRERARQQSGDLTLDCPPLGPLDEILRPYQKQGVAWLAFLRRNGFGGILADEMGLGKTLQALALVSWTRSASGDTPPAPGCPHLVICPTSLVSNWVAEAARFAPRLRVLALEGPRRDALFQRIPDHDLVVTSYALVRRDLERYRRVEFDTVILDEAQHIKNRQTQNAQAVKAVRSRHRLVLTGTPLENSVLDLWSIFDFLMPGYLGTAVDFRDRYEVPIVRERSEAAQTRLARRVRPFVLRRRKRDVAPELPPRIDQVVWCDLSEDQAAVYAALLDATRRQVTEAVGQQGLARSRMLVLTALLRLRQACCDLRLLDLDRSAGSTPVPESERPDRNPAQPPDEPDAGKSESGKMNAFDELLEEVLDGGHRALVFSQFTSLLALLRQRLDEAAVRYCYLDGSTRDRAGEVNRFQQAADIPVFLVSLKAGGVGLNLTAADTVIHLDPWWNPAVEDQATDRAHRIGQTRVVTSYKLITRGTVEEKILQLQQRKRDVIGGLLADEEQLSQSLSWDEIRDLLT